MWHMMVDRFVVDLLTLCLPSPSKSLKVFETDDLRPDFGVSLRAFLVPFTRRRKKPGWFAGPLLFWFKDSRGVKGWEDARASYPDIPLGGSRADPQSYRSIDL
jgi:hypothetical protein